MFEPINDVTWATISQAFQAEESLRRELVAREMGPWPVE